LTIPGGGTEKLLINSADPNQDVNGEKAYYKTQHPHFKVPEVRQALALLIDRKTIADQLYGPGGKATGQTQNENAPYMLPDSDPAAQWKFDVAAANALLDKAGAAKGASGLRELNGRPLKWLYQTSVNSVRQKNQEIVKQALQQAGCDADLKSVDASVYFSGDAGNNDTTGHFYADLEMYTNGAGVFPLDWYRRYYSGNPDVDIDQKSNGWSAYNPMRYQSDKFNQLWAQAQKELDPQKSISLFQDMQRTVLADVAEIGIVNRLSVSAISTRITGNDPSPWASEFWNIQDWTTK
jgi:peptide/nickel transport system substrate-binding protein